MNRTKKLFSNTALFAISNFGSRLITFLLVPLYTAVLTKEQYGTIDVILTSVSLILPLVTLSMSEAVMRFSMDLDADRKSIFSTGLIVVVCGYIISVLPVMLLSNYLKVSKYTGLILLLLLFNSIYQFVSQFCRGIDQILNFSIAGLLQTLVFVSSNILMVLVLKKGIYGYLISSCIAFAVPIIYLVIMAKIPRYLGGKIDRQCLGEMMKYALPLIPNTLFWWVMNASDKLFISSMLGKSFNGLYAVASKIPSIINIISTIFFQAWQLSAIEESRSNDKREYYAGVFENLSSVIFLSVSALMVVIKPLYGIWVAKEFYEAWISSPFLLIAVSFMCFASFWGTLLIAQKKSGGILLSATVGCVVNLILNYVLIPRYRLVGAAVATIIGFSLTWIIRVFATNKTEKIEIKWNKQMVSILLILLQMCLLYIPPAYISSTVVRICFQVVLLIINIIVNRKTVVLAFEIIKTIFKKISLKKVKR